MAVTGLEIVYKSPHLLKNYERNSRRHSPQQIDAIRKSIREFGFTNPVLLKDDGVTIGAGHARTEAARAEDMTSIPTITLTGLTDEQWRAYVIADNQLAIAGSSWDPAMLQFELKELKALSFNLGVIGFPELELKKVLEPAEFEEAKDKVSAELKKLKTMQPMSAEATVARGDALG